jgi:hypothetical protein
MGQQLEIVTARGRFFYSLRGSADAIDATTRCVAALQSPPAAPSATQRGFRMLTELEASALLSKILTSAGLESFKIDPPEANGNLVFFRLADGSRGLFQAAIGNTQGADDFTGTVISRQSKFCRGDFMSGKRALPSTDGSVVRVVTTTCREGDGAVVTESTIIRRANGFLMELSQAFPVTRGATSSQQLSGGNRAALVDAALRAAE